MKITRARLKKLVEHEMETNDQREDPRLQKGFEPENQGEYSNTGGCNHDFYGVLLGYLGGSEEAAQGFCEILHGSRVGTPSQMLEHAMREYRISADAEWELTQAFRKIYGPEIDAGREWGPKDWEDEEDPPFTETLDKLIKEELNKAISKTESGFLSNIYKWCPDKSPCAPGKEKTSWWKKK